MCVLEQKRIESFKGNKAKSGGEHLKNFFTEKWVFHALSVKTIKSTQN